MKKACLIAIALPAFAAPALAADTWRGLVVAPEDRCAAYNKRRDYPYSRSVEARIVAGPGRPNLWSLHRAHIFLDAPDRH